MGDPCGAFAQDGPVETVVVTATASPVEFQDLTRGVTVIGREEIQRLPVQSVADLLNYVAGIDARSRSPFGVQTDFSARGAGFGQILVLIDGVRVNDSQTGHHNSDWAIGLSDVERIEVLHGTGSSVYGADSFGATINLVTRQGGGDRVRASAGQHGFLEAEGRTSFEVGGVSQSLTLFGNRSSGFMYDRDFQTVGFSGRTDFGSERSLQFGHLDKAFGANGFYGPSPSQEWTEATRVSFTSPLFEASRQPTHATLFYRTHGDRFLWDRRQPGQFENRHRTHAAGLLLKRERALREGSRLTWGGEIGQDWIDSSNLGRHWYRRWAAYAELQQRLGDRVSLVPGVRFDHYSSFGSSASPSVSAGWWLHPRVKLRSSLGHAFRIPTFTELYYSDPNHQASSGLRPEKGWEIETGYDWLAASDLLVQGAAYSRWDEDLIDWVRASTEEKWRTANIRALRSKGVEVGVQKLLNGGNTMVRVQYAWLDSRPEALNLISKYTEDFARHSISAMGSLNLPGALHLGLNGRYRMRSSGRSYFVLDQKWMRDFGMVSAFLEVSNLLDTRYEEIQGIVMPGRWIRAGFEWALESPN